jgi:capsular polysaccharide biosynthesis protein
LPLKIGLGFAVGVALAFAAHYFDPFVREKEELEKLGLRVIAEVPKREKRKR